MWIREDDEFMGQFFEPSGDRFEIEHLEKALEYVPRRRFALDVGAHYGSWTRYLSRNFDRVIAFEPVPETFACLQRNVEEFANVEILNQAVGEAPGMVNVAVGKMYSHPGMETVVGAGETKMVRIDDLKLQNLDFLKIDVEGYELFVLRGGEQTLLRHRPTIILEENIRGSLEHGIENGECGVYLATLGARLIGFQNKDLIFGWPDPATEIDAFVAQFPGAHIAAVDAELITPITGFVGRDLATDRAEFNVVGGERPSAPRSPFVVVSFYTEGNGYDVHAARLRESLDRVGVPHSIEPVEDAISWERVCAYKPQFVLRKWREFDVPVVWLDADAVVEQSPDLFAAVDADFAAHRWTWEVGQEHLGHEMASGTLYFGKTALAEKLLERWTFRSAADPDTWDQKHLESAWCDISSLYPLRTAWLPRPYLQINGGLELAPSVVRHMQASRTEKPRRGRPAAPQFMLSEAGVEDRRRNRLWRTSEQAFWIAEGVDHIVPNVGHDFPEGFDVREMLERCLGTDSSVLEFGCGVGRIASLFEPERYLGVDINPASIAEARRRNPGHEIRIWDVGQVVPPTDVLLFYTVLLHVSDDAVRPMVEALCEGRQQVLIAELMDRRWRREGNPPVFNRDPEEYVLLMETLGFKFVGYEKEAYVRYDQQPWNVGRDSRITFLKFERPR
jgi:FkbM family methyltransferase